MHVFFQVVTVGPAADRFTPSTMSPFETTRFSTDIIAPKETDGDNSLDRWERTTSKANDNRYEIIENEIVYRDGRGSRMYDKGHADEVTSENLWERTEVLAGKSKFLIGHKDFGWINFLLSVGPKEILIQFLALSSCNSLWSGWIPLCRFPPPPPGLPHEEEGWRQLWPGGHQTFQCTVSQSPHQGVLRLSWIIRTLKI